MRLGVVTSNTSAIRLYLCHGFSVYGVEREALFVDGVYYLSEADLDVVGLSAYPWGLDPQLPFGAIWWWTNRELIHHGAEIGLLRDLWAAQPTQHELEA